MGSLGKPSFVERSDPQQELVTQMLADHLLAVGRDCELHAVLREGGEGLA
jgi:hypothetical protein